MIAAPTLPGGREVAAWWRELAARQPRRLWYASLLVHRVEALAVVASPAPLDPVHRALLQALSSSSPPGSLRQMGLDRHILSGCLRELVGAGFICSPATGNPKLTPAGQQALERGVGVGLHKERRVFHFLDNSTLNRPAEFLDLQPDIFGQNEAGAFDLQCLRNAVASSPEWKAHRHFPVEVHEIVGLSSGGKPQHWREVIVVQPQRMSFALIECPAANDSTELSGFPIEPASWRIRADCPAFILNQSRLEVLPDLDAPSLNEEWAMAWRTWCDANSSAKQDAAAWTAQWTGESLRVQAPGPADRARLAPLLKDAGWILAGHGRLRWCAPVELVEKSD